VEGVSKLRITAIIVILSEAKNLRASAFKIKFEDKYYVIANRFFASLRMTEKPGSLTLSML
jgi:hypothetical protein